MYQPAHNLQPDPQQLRALIRAYPLGAWVVAGEEGLIANHVPFLLADEPAPQAALNDAAAQAPMTLHAHVARANPVWRALPGRLPCVVMFQGPEAYVTPAWYPSKAEHGKVVPTWNYAVVHAEGQARAIHERPWLREHVTRLTRLQEAGRAPGWEVADAPDDYIERMLDAIVGIEIVVSRVTGKWKISQNRPAADRAGVIAGLQQEARPGAQAMADMMTAHEAAPLRPAPGAAS